MRYLDFMRSLWGLFDLRERWMLCMLLAGMTIGAAFEAVGIGLVVPLISAIGNPSLLQDHRAFKTLYEWIGARSTEDFLLRISILLLIVYALKNLYLGSLAYLQSSFIYGKQAQLSAKLLTHYLRRPYAFHLQQNSVDLQFNTMGLVANVTGGVVSPLLLVFSETLVLAFLLAVLFAVEPRATAIAIVAVVGLGLAYQKGFKNILSRHGRGSSTAAKGMHRTVRQALGSIKEIRISGRERYFISAFGKDGSSYVRSAGVFAALNAFPRLLTEMLVVGGLLLTVVVLLMQPGAIERAFPMLALIGTAALRVMPSFTRITSALTGIRFNVASVHALSLGTLQASSRLDDAEPDDEARLPRFEVMEFVDVHYTYAGAQKGSLADVRLQIRRGDYVGIVGSTGAGKSTLINVMLGLLEPTRGKVLIGAQELHKVRKQWQRRIGYVPQSIFLLDDSVRRNVAFGLPDGAINDADVWLALDAARVGAFVRTLPKQLDTVIGDNGIRLSGGERQRLGIARALFERPEVLIFDEATSSVDGQTEREINETIAGLGGERTIIVVTHRLGAVIHCDRIYLVSGGKIVDAGSYEDLLARSESFRRMANEPLA
jgi:ATP-binding cassette, subfamily B, bacterial PglK